MSTITPKTYAYVSLRDAQSITVRQGNGMAVTMNRPGGVYLSADGSRVTVRTGRKSRTFHPVDFRVLALDLGKRGVLNNLSAGDFFEMFLGRK